jgi:pimeloyl-ACP methyl ester carboxylesterase
LLPWTLIALGALLVLASAALLLLAWLAHQREAHAARDIAPRAGKFVRAADVELFVQEDGPAGGTPVLFVHGTGAWSETWRSTLTAAAAAGFRAIAIDLPPFGFSQRPDAPRYSREDQGRRILGALDALAIDKAILVGHSFGGGPTVEAAMLQPQRLRGLVLVDVALGLPAGGAAPSEPSALLDSLFGVRALRDGVVAAFLTNPQFTRTLLQMFIADPAKATDERVGIYQQPLAVKGSTQAIGAWLPAFFASPAAARSGTPDAYRALAMPVAIIWGDADTVTPLAQGEHLARLVNRAELVVLPGIGHIPQLEDPARFNETLMRLLRSIAAR